MWREFTIYTIDSQLAELGVDNQEMIQSRLSIDLSVIIKYHDAGETDGMPFTALYDINGDRMDIQMTYEAFNEIMKPLTDAHS